MGFNLTTIRSRFFLEQPDTRILRHFIGTTSFESKAISFLVCDDDGESALPWARSPRTTLSYLGFHQSSDEGDIDNVTESPLHHLPEKRQSLARRRRESKLDIMASRHSIQSLRQSRSVKKSCSKEPLSAGYSYY